MSASNYIELGVIALLTLDRALPGVIATVRKLKAPSSLQALAEDVADIKAGVGLVGIAITEARSVTLPITVHGATAAAPIR